MHKLNQLLTPFGLFFTAIHIAILHRATKPSDVPPLLDHARSECLNAHSVHVPRGFDLRVPIRVVFLQDQALRAV